MISDSERARRRNYLGSSDSAAVAGKDPWRSGGDVWLEKTGRLPPDATDAAKTIGNYLEPSVLSWAEDTLDTELSRDVSLTHPNHIQCANLDAAALALTPAAIIEAKAIGMLARPEYYSQFGRDGTDDLPDHIVFQVTHAMYVARAQPDWVPIEVAYVPVLLVGRGFQMFKVPYDEALAEAITEHELRWWRDYVIADVPPPTVPTLDHLRWRTREAGKSVALESVLVQQWQAAKGVLKQAEEVETRTKAAVLYALGDADIGLCADGQVTYRESVRAGYTVQPSTVRTLRWKGMK